MSETVIELHGVEKRFGRNQVLESVTLRVERGQVFAFLGRNGAGKTTTIGAMLGLLRPDRGSIRVLGRDPVKDSLELRRRVGFLAEDQRLWGWMRVEEALAFLKPFYPTWDDALARDLVARFELPPRTRVKHLSKGQNVRLGLILALAHRPELVILDDPTLGLDPILRKEFLREVVEHLQSAGTTVFFSSHLLYEVEPVADAVAILENGRIVCQASTEALREDVKRLILPAPAYDALGALGALPGTLDVKRRGGQVAVVVKGAGAALDSLAANGVEPEVVDLNLDEIFEAYVIGRNDGKHPEEPHLERVA